MPPKQESSRVGVPDLADWRMIRAEPSLLPPGDWTWADGLGTSLRPLADGRFVIRAEGIASAVVSEADRSIRLFDREGPEELADDWIIDQIAPRLLAHLGHFVLHGGAVDVGGDRAILLVAPSGHGKSTLTGYLHDGGWPMLGDDAIVVGPTGEGSRLRSVYRRLKLRPDSWHQLFPSDRRSRGGAGWKLSLDLTGEAPPAPEPRLAAVFVLDGPDSDGEPEARHLASAATCVALLRNSFALDPADRARAAGRLAQASALAAAVPGFRLSYRRDYALLPQVRDLIRATLDQAQLPERTLP